MQKLWIGNLFFYKLCIAENGVHWRTNVVRHIEQKGCLCLICSFCRFISYFELLLFKLLLLLLAHYSCYIKHMSNLSVIITLFLYKTCFIPVSVVCMIIHFYCISIRKSFRKRRQIEKPSCTCTIFLCNNRIAKLIQLTLCFAFVPCQSMYSAVA